MGRKRTPVSLADPDRSNSAFVPELVTWDAKPIPLFGGFQLGR